MNEYTKWCVNVNEKNIYKQSIAQPIVPCATWQCLIILVFLPSTDEFPEIAAKVLELPYTGDAMSMFVFLPTEEGPLGFARMVDRLSGNNLRAATHKGNLSFRTVDVKLPKFKMEVEIREQFKPVSVYCHFVFDVS